MVQPALEPPPGKVSNFDNPNREMYYICIASNAVAIPVCTIFVALRMYARYRLSMRLQADDSMSRHDSASPGPPCRLADLCFQLLVCSDL